MTKTNVLRSTRRQFMAGAASTAALVALDLPALGQAATRITTGFGWIANVEHATFWRALDGGFFAEEGIDADYLAGGPGLPNPLVNLSAGQLQVAGADWVPVISAIDKGNDFGVLGAHFPVSPSAFLSLAADPVRTPADLVGKRILLQNQSNRAIVDTVLSNAGLPLDYEMVPTGFSPEPLLAGDGEVFLCFATNQPIALERLGMTEGDDFVVTLLNDLGYRIPGALITVDRGFVAERRDLMVGYLRALIRGYRANLEDPGIAAALAVDKYGADYGLDLAQQTRQNELQIPLMRAAEQPGPFLLDVGAAAEAFTAAAKVAGVENVPDMSTVFDLSLLEEALASV